MTEEKFEDYVYINKLYLTVLGIWPLQDDAATWRFYIQKIHSIIIIILWCTLLIIPMILDVYIVWGDINAVVQNLCFTVHAFSLALKFSHVIANRNSLEELLKVMKNNWYSSLCASASKDHKNILLQHAGLARNITKCFLLSVYIFMSLCFLLPFIYGIDSDPARIKRYPFCSWYYYDQYSNVVYAFCYSVQLVIGLCLGVSYNVGMDSFCCVAIYHSCAQLNIIQSELLNVGDESKPTQKAITELIKNHNEQIRIVQKLNQLISKLCLYQLMTSCVAICFIGFQLIIALTNTEIDFHAFFMYLGFVTANLFQILLFCWPSNELMEQSFEIGNAAYQSSWTNLSQDSSKAIMLMILRTQTPLIISAGGMYEMTLQNFTAIVKASMSFLSLLRAVYAKD